MAFEKKVLASAPIKAIVTTMMIRPVMRPHRFVKFTTGVPAGRPEEELEPS